MKELCDRGLHQFVLGAKVDHSIGKSMSLRTYQYDIECVLCGEMITQRFLNMDEIPEEVINDFYTRMNQLLDDKYPPLEGDE